MKARTGTAKKAIPRPGFPARKDSEGAREHAGGVGGRPGVTSLSEATRKFL